MQLVAWCDPGWPLSRMFRYFVRNQNADRGRPQVWKEIAES
jgi:hypothetical protein